MLTQDRRNVLLSDIYPDSHRVVAAKDPPGQRCVYIYPGEPEREIYRLSTFNKFPNHVPIDRNELAAAGFYYTGYKDRVKCFSCGIAVEEWTITDDAKSRALHLESCEMASLSCARNQPINTRPLTRRHQPTTSQNHTQQPVTRPTRQQPVTRQTSSAGEVLMNGTNASNNQPNATSSNHQPYQTATIAPTNNQPSTNTSSSNDNNNESSYLFDLFPCNNPANPHMRSAVSREQTFIGNHSWPGDRIRATPRQIAEAGMFYLGSRDRVKCWYCNGGLQNWDTSDDPWFEHAKWYPECEFVLQAKGPDFVESVGSQFPDLVRPTRRNNQQNAAQTSSQAAPEIIDPQVEIQERNRKVETEMKDSPLVENAKRMGFSDEEIKQAFYRKFESSNTTFQEFSSLVESILSNTNSQNPTVSMETEATPTTSATVPKQIAPTSALEELRSLERSRLCKSCKREVSNVVFLPCGHLSACSNCSKVLKKCPVCQAKITDNFKVFMS